MKNYSKQGLRVAALSLFCMACVAGNSAIAQSSEVHSDNFGTNNQYYYKQINDGSFSNASYEKLDYSYNNFYEILAPYGQWIEDAQYGYVWSPDVDASFRPYFSGGHWAMTDYGNTWVSEYQWGWAVFHYGRWTFDAYYGWLWIPGSQWGPAWVSWRSGLGVFGWAPLAPGYEFSAKELNQYTPPKDWWVYLAPEYLYGGDYYRYLYGATGSNVTRKNTTPMDNTYEHKGVTYVGGPSAKQVGLLTIRPVPLFHINNAGTPRAEYVHHETIKMFRPAEIKQVPESGEHVTPPNVITAPKVISSKPQAITINGGNNPQFRVDLPNIIKHTPRTVAPVKYTTDIKKGSNWEEEHRADKYPYKTDLNVPDPVRAGGSNTIKRPEKAKVPEQGNQAPEPVEIPKEKKNAQPPVNPEQHPDPVPEMPKPKNDPPAPTPKQHPEPITK